VGVGLRRWRRRLVWWWFFGEREERREVRSDWQPLEIAISLLFASFLLYDFKSLLLTFVSALRGVAAEEPVPLEWGEDVAEVGRGQGAEGIGAAAAAAAADRRREESREHRCRRLFSLPRGEARTRKSTTRLRQGKGSPLVVRGERTKRETERRVVPGGERERRELELDRTRK
jgi:hypothetical protein